MGFLIIFFGSILLVAVYCIITIDWNDSEDDVDIYDQVDENGNVYYEDVSSNGIAYRVYKD